MSKAWMVSALVLTLAASGCARGRAVVSPGFAGGAHQTVALGAFAGPPREEGERGVVLGAAQAAMVRCGLSVVDAEHSQQADLVVTGSADMGWDCAKDVTYRAVDASGHVLFSGRVGGLWRELEGRNMGEQICIAMGKPVG